MKPIKTYACYLKNDEVRMSSSSGAVFSALASYVFSLNGIVYGVSMSEDCYSAEFISVTDKEGLKRLRGSKYLQAKIGNTYKSVKTDLLAGKTVLFTGTGCQINGLKNFLRKDYDNLICVDVICHGVPSPTLWREYVRYQEKKIGGKLQYINFRCKGDSWIDSGMKEVVQTIPSDALEKNYISKDVDPYMQMFLRNYCLRPSCYACVAKVIKTSDLTIADFWGIQKVAPDMNDNRGTSLVLIRTEKGNEVFNNVSKTMNLKEVSYEDGVRENTSEYRSVAKPVQRNTFFLDMRNMDFDELAVRYVASVKISTKTKVKRMIKNILKRIIRVRPHNSDFGLLFVFRTSERRFD